jgi:hypothetical protein
MDKFVQNLRRDIDSYHIDEYDMQNNIKNICKANGYTFINEYLYYDDSCFTGHSGDFVVNTGNKYYVIETKIINTHTKNRNYSYIEKVKIGRKKVVKNQVVKYTKLFYEFMKTINPTFWNMNILQGVSVTDEGINVECFLLGNDIIYDKENICIDISKYTLDKTKNIQIIEKM